MAQVMRQLCTDIRTARVVEHGCRRVDAATVIVPAAFPRCDGVLASDPGVEAEGVGLDFADELDDVVGGIVVLQHVSDKVVFGHLPPSGDLVERE